MFKTRKYNDLEADIEVDLTCFASFFMYLTWRNMNQGEMIKITWLRSSKQ
jgi:hypothetical protein